MAMAARYIQAGTDRCRTRSRAHGVVGHGFATEIHAWKAIAEAMRADDTTSGAVAPVCAVIKRGPTMKMPR
jgi:hypothetical protein